jgi:cytochrome b6-f complex iron-sulfur subunit
MESLNRKDFIKQAGCSALFLMAMGITVTACDTAEVAGPKDDTTPGGGGNTADGITITPTTITLDLSKPGAAVLNNAGGFLLIGAANAMAVNVNGTIRAFTSVCTHAQCTTSWAFESSRLICTCHGSQFSTEGQVVIGPATAPLKSFASTRNGNIVTITRG